MSRSFDIAETQILVNFLADPYPCHGRILFEQLQGPVWLSYRPDVDDGPQELDLNFETWDLVARNSLISPAHVATGVYWFEPLTVAQLRQMRQEARTRARLLGGAVGAAATQLYWYYSDEEKKKTDVDDRFLHIEYEGESSMQVIGDLENADWKLSMFSGPQATLEFLQAVAAAPGSLIS